MYMCIKTKKRNQQNHHFNGSKHFFPKKNYGTTAYCFSSKDTSRENDINLPPKNYIKNPSPLKNKQKNILIDLIISILMFLN